MSADCINTKTGNDRNLTPIAVPHYRQYPTTIEEQSTWVVLETQHGCYSNFGFCYAGVVPSLEEAINRLNSDPQLYSDYRVVSRAGEVLYNPNELEPDWLYAP